METVHDGPAALSAARTIKPEVAPMDIGLPGMDGLQVAGRMRQQRELVGPTLIAMTGNRKIVSGRRPPALTTTLSSPVSFTKLKELLNQVADERSKG